MKARYQRIETHRLGQRVVAIVERVFPFGVFVRFTDGTEAYVRRRELTQDGAVNPEDVVSVGQEIQALVIDLPEADRVMELSVRQAEPDPWENFACRVKVNDTVTAAVKAHSARGVWAQVMPGVDGFIPTSELAPWPVEQPGSLLWIGDQLEAVITHLDQQGKVLRLSIRRQLVRTAQVQTLAHQYSSNGADGREEGWLEDLDDVQAIHPVRGSLQDLERVLVLDDHQDVCEGLVAWLERHGCLADGFGRPAMALDHVQRQTYRAALVDLDLAGEDGLQFIQDLRDLELDLHVMVMSIPEWIAERSQDLESLDVIEVFAKPLQMDEVHETLTRLAQGQHIGSYRVTDSPQEGGEAASFHRLAQTLRSHQPLMRSLKKGLAALTQCTGAELAVLFCQDAASGQVSVVAQSGNLPIRQEAIHALSSSPVKDLIVEGGHVLEKRLSAKAQRRFRKLLDVVSFQSCIGVPVPAAGSVEHALFLFHRELEVFNKVDLRDAWAVAALLSAALDAEVLRRRVETIGPLLLSGQLAASFGHEVFNRMSALELQVRNLRAGSSMLSDQGGSPSQGEDTSPSPRLAEDMDRLLDATIDLKETVEVFRGLIQAGDQCLVDVNATVRQAIQLVQALACRNRVRIVLGLMPDLPHVIGAPAHLEHVFLNLALNAIQQMTDKRERWPEADGQLKVETGLDPEAALPLWVRLTDSGPGIHRELWDRIFTLGYSTRRGGTGLGLFVARSLVESMGGVLQVEQSLIPTGTTFRVELPMVAYGL